MLGNFLTDYLFGMTLFTILVGLTIGVLVAYLWWGLRYYQVLETEAKSTEMSNKTELLRKEQALLHARLRKL